MEALVAICAVVVALAAVGAAARIRRRRRRAEIRARVVCRPQRYETPPAARSFAFVDVSKPDPVHPTSMRLQDQPEAWRRRMRAAGRRLSSAGVREITFVHGTFVGTDPFSLLTSLQTLSPRVDATLTERLGRWLKSASDQIARDRGNFHRPYVDLFRAAVALPCSLFVWSSENTHSARLRAAAQLAHHLVQKLDDLEDPDPPRILLVGHSHAGQVFALLLQLVAECQHAPELVRICGRLGEDVDWLLVHLERLRRIDVDVVTFGTPVRYGWPVRERGRLVHFVNHRGPEPLAGTLDGVPTTRDGDYIQQWGIAGSDLPAASTALRATNRELDELLGPGHAPSAWLELLEHRKRVHDGGLTLLVDYGDAAIRGPNFLQTNFGHAVYTRRSTMSFWLRQVARRLY